ncbi:aspartate/glutamate racemase family protein [Vibrio superstes]|uniref:Aspartate racemase n=1 Tax=Vibrio superstes NBRC 103154 TaxID=1219062 RepID=A0A511QQL0_9VIBR|nr:amino acid racemase [Vibrio superstes]GEM79630.1 aspartate racemase [Vibrio superstes NBRC 103154]
MKKILFGVIGNMGPEADALFQDIVAKKEMDHGALKDQDHMGMLVVKNPDIPDRSEAINEGGQDPVRELLKSAQLLERNNVRFAVMTCNTAHYFRERVQQCTGVYMVDMLKTTVDLIKEQNPEAIVGILCTNGTYNSGIYDQYLNDAHLVYVKPDSYAQEHYVHSAIYGEVTGEKTPCGQDIRIKNGIKSGEFERNAVLLGKALQPLVDKGVTSVILGCTELPLVRKFLQTQFPDVHFIDPMEAVANRVVRIYKKAEQLMEENYIPKVGMKPETMTTDEEIINYILSHISY